MRKFQISIKPQPANNEPKFIGTHAGVYENIWLEASGRKRVETERLLLKLSAETNDIRIALSSNQQGFDELTTIDIKV